MHNSKSIKYFEFVLIKFVILFRQERASNKKTTIDNKGEKEYDSILGFGQGCLESQ